MILAVKPLRQHDRLGAAVLAFGEQSQGAAMIELWPPGR
jgi:hypothetical protein